MLNSVTYPALNAKMKGMYAKNLDKKDLEELLKQSNLKEAIYFLKTKFPNLENLNENMHRKEIEQELNNLFIYEILKLFKYLNKKEIDLVMHFLAKYEINCVKNVFRNVTTDSKIYLKNIDNWTTKMFKNINGINQIEEEKAFFELIKKEDYYKIFEEYEDIIDNVPLEEIEVKLDKYYFQNVFKLGQKVNKNLEYIIGTEIDLLNIIWIYRAKKYFQYSVQQVNDIIIPINYKLSKRNLLNLINTSTYEEMYNILQNTVYKKVFSDENTLEHDKEKYLYDINLKMFRTKLFDICTVFCNINLIDIEIKNIINIIEGIRYNLDKSEIQRKIIV